jgi:hypothetical protein
MTDITIREGHLSPRNTKEVIVEDGDWEVCVWVHNGAVDIVVNNRGDRTIRMADTHKGTKFDLDDDRTEVALRFTAKRSR